MPQIFQVLRCYKCLVFQVHQTKKSNQFLCKMCGEKQSIKRHYGLGNAQECRKNVQKLNSIRGEMDESKNVKNISSDDDDDHVLTDDKYMSIVRNVMPLSSKLEIKQSKWSEYIEKNVEHIESSTSDDKMYLDDTEVILELPRKRQKIFSESYNKTKSLKSSPEPIPTSVVNSSKSPPCKHTPKITTFTPPLRKEIKQSPKLGYDSQSSKWAGLNNGPDDTLSLKQSKAYLVQTIDEGRKKFVPPTINKNSKWAKFAEVTEDNNEDYELEESTITQSNSQNDPNDLFSLCDDNEIDDYLTI